MLADCGRMYPRAACNSNLIVTLLFNFHRACLEAMQADPRVLIILPCNCFDVSCVHTKQITKTQDFFLKTPKIFDSATAHYVAGPRAAWALNVDVSWL